jgi:hypothetical protein
MVRRLRRALGCLWAARPKPGTQRRAAPIPDPIRVAFFVLNVLGVALTAYVLLQYAVRARDQAFARSERLLLNVLPRPIAERLKHTPGIIAESHPEVTVLFADVVDFTPFTLQTAPERVVGVLDEVFSAFDRLAAQHGLEKIKTIGDAYMVAAGLPVPRPDHAQAMANMAIDMLTSSRASVSRSTSTWRSGSAWRVGPWSPASSAATSSAMTSGATPSTPRAAWSHLVSRAGSRSVWGRISA